MHVLAVRPPVMRVPAARPGVSCTSWLSGPACRALCRGAAACRVLGHRSCSTHPATTDEPASRHGQPSTRPRWPAGRPDEPAGPARRARPVNPVSR
ncbi:hypothetical protein [Ornithinimicrobium kibberense]|uniref:hypothetical protein n=1 Tax=Ornithinimicrobium kibberense TaxID=282060 RepID=UPI0036235A17